ADGSPDPAFVLNEPRSRTARVLVTGQNFGCGSSREHAVWALLGAGFRAVISSAFADIFRGNALGNGLLPIEVGAAHLDRLLAEDRADAEVGVDLERTMVTLPDGEAFTFPVPPFARHCLLHGLDEMQFLLGANAEVDRYERGVRASFDTRQASVPA
ncbi:MAG: 3-isopropylmalate dehydratase small subunit, partial [Gemmatimonadaceae bacterium]|nr:3-isopropylmalate dehydratase small subunit [Gemmatimonadaceae bacterium]